VSDRIVLGLAGDEEVRAVVDAWGSYIAGETLAVEVGEAVPGAEHVADIDVDGRAIRLELRRVRA
jgi:hypothetical protein